METGPSEYAYGTEKVQYFAKDIFSIRTFKSRRQDARMLQSNSDVLDICQEK